MRIGVLVCPHLRIFESDRVNNQDVSFPMTKFFSEEGRIRIFGMLALCVDGNEAEVAIPVKESNLICALENFKWKTARVVPRNPSENAKAFRIDRRGGVVYPRRFPRWG